MSVYLDIFEPHDNYLTDLTTILNKIGWYTPRENRLAASLMAIDAFQDDDRLNEVVTNRLKCY